MDVEQLREELKSVYARLKRAEDQSLERSQLDFKLDWIREIRDYLERAALDLSIEHDPQTGKKSAHPSVLAVQAQELLKRL